MNSKMNLCRLALLLILFVGHSALISAAVKLSIADFTLAYNENQKQVALVLENDQEVTQFQVDLTLPEGLTIASIEKNATRLTGRGVYIEASPVEGGKIRILKTGGDAIAIGNGEVITITMNSTLTAGEYYIDFSDAVISNAAAEDVATATTGRTKVTKEAVPEIGNCSFAAVQQSIEVTDDEEYQIDITLDNEGIEDLSAFSGILTLPTGLVLVPGNDGKFIYTDRTPEPLEFQFEESGNAISFVLSSSSNTLITGTSGIIFSFVVKADVNATLAETSNIVLSNLRVANNAGISSVVLPDVTIAVTKKAAPIVPGDFDGDGEVGDDDVDFIIDALLDGTYPTDPNDPMFAIYDINGDGEIDIADAQAAFNLSMGLNADGTQK